MGVRNETESMKAQRSVRLKARKPDVPENVKIGLKTTDDKINVLRNKKILRKSKEFSKVWIRSSTSHNERLLNINSKKIFELLPGGENY